MKIKLIVEHNGHIPTGGWYYITEHEIDVPDKLLPDDVKKALDKNPENRIKEDLNIIGIRIVE